MEKTFLTIAEFCAAYGVNRNTAYRQINAGLIPIVKVGRATFIGTADAERWAGNLSRRKKKLAEILPETLPLAIFRVCLIVLDRNWSKLLRLCSLLFRLLGHEVEF